MKKQLIEDILRQALRPELIEVQDESHMHKAGNESHFRLVVASDQFKGQSKVNRQRQVTKILSAADIGYHALSMHLYDPQEWQTANPAASPNCLGKN